MSSSSRPPKRKAAEAAESKMAANADQIDRIDEVLESKDIVDDGIDLHAQVHPRLVHEQVAGWHEQMLAPVVVHRILRVDVERMTNHTAACRAPLEAPSAARAWCEGRSGYCSARPRDPKRHVDFCWNLRSTAWFNAEHNIRRRDYDSDSDDIDTSSDEVDDVSGLMGLFRKPVSSPDSHWTVYL